MLSGIDVGLKADREFVDMQVVLNRCLLCGIFLLVVAATAAASCLPPHTQPAPVSVPGPAVNERVPLDPGHDVAVEERRTVLAASAAGYTIHRDVPEVRLQFTVADDRGKLITGLTARDVRVFDNQSPVSEFHEFLRQDDLPLQIGILLDVSDSVQKTLVREKVATRLFLQQVLRPQSDRAFLLAFSSDLRLWQSPIGDRTQLQNAAQKIDSPGSTTNLYDALFYTSRNYFAPSADEAAVQRIIVLFSDGNDTGSLHTLADTIAQAQRRDIQIYAIAVHRKGWNLRGDETLAYIADTTGGHFYVANTEKDFPALFDAMAQQMRTRYTLSFPPARDTAGFHSLRLETTIPQRVQVHARQGYYFEAR